ncbi:hypothetical protein [Celerinatantimonas sp. YJH-8]|uniref:hypothetical protein n=1 Tax=Celerinatantimonas sp. YJH-8 TaxID=3228714 RepID=UPI0038C11219
MSANYPQVEDVQELKMHSDALVSQMMTYGAQCVDAPLLREQLLYGTQVWCSQLVDRYQRSPQASKEAIISHLRHKATQLSMVGGQLSAIKYTAESILHTQQVDPEDDIPSIHWAKDSQTNVVHGTQIPDINNEMGTDSDRSGLKPWEKDINQLEQKLNIFNNNINSPVGFIASAAQIKAENKLATERVMFTDELRFYRTVVLQGERWSRVAGTAGLLIIIGSTINDEYTMWQEGASTQQLEIRALSGIFDIIATVVGFLGPWGVAASLIYYGIEMGMEYEGINQNPLIYLYEHELKGVLEYVEDLL